METPYHSTRNFDNLFFENKNEILNKINFFLQNKLWYEKMGIPYTLGIGLHGPPGTGKTSFIKALANFTDRHIIIISLKLLKKKYHLEEYFFETRYNLLNKKDSISFDNKIIVLEDIDCCDDIVLQRNDKKDNSLHDILVEKLSTKTEVNGVRTDKNEDSIYKSVLNEKEPDVTLDDLLNIIDGIQEATGRILIITSNFYNKLDDALTRPGRIDINMELKNTNHTTIREMYTHFFNKDIKESDLKKIEEYKYSPAYLVNHFIKYNNNDKCILNNLFK